MFEPGLRSARAALSEVSLRGLNAIDADAVQDLAREVWHGSRALSLGELLGPYRNDALRLVERLASFDVTPELRRRVLRNQIRAASGFTLGGEEEASSPAFDEVYGRLLDHLRSLQQETPGRRRMS